MKEIRERINTAYQLVSCMSVKGDAVDVVADIRRLLREADALTQTADNQEEVHPHA